MSECAVKAAGEFLADIGKLPYVIFVTPHFVSAINAFNSSLPKRNAADIAITLEDCIETSSRKSLKKSITTVIVSIVALIIITIAIIIAIMSYISGYVRLPNIVAFLVIILIVVIIISFYILYKSTINNIESIDLSPCIANANKSVSIYEEQIDKAINTGLCAY